jgi:hypothetical protein
MAVAQDTKNIVRRPNRKTSNREAGRDRALEAKRSISVVLPVAESCKKADLWKVKDL